jgi:hypothetical protein
MDEAEEPGWVAEIDRLALIREARDRWFATDPRSPLTPEQKQTFRGMRYFDEDPSLCLRLEVEVFPMLELVELDMSDGSRHSYHRWGRVRFAVHGQSVSLVVYRDPISHRIVLPFHDAERGRETSITGRYVDVEERPDHTLEIDFNFAYNPYSTYRDDLVCPLPPPENWLDVAIRAGEKRFVT